jgi:hypothetical protein
MNKRKKKHCPACPLPKSLPPTALSQESTKAREKSRRRRHRTTSMKRKHFKKIIHKSCFP